MLKEYPRQADSGRRWFSDQECDLIVWQDGEAAISGFQLCYDKNRNERASAWTNRRGYLHERVDDGESNPSKNSSPVLAPDRNVSHTGNHQTVLEKSSEIDPEIRLFVADKLRQYRSP